VLLASPAAGATPPVDAEMVRKDVFVLAEHDNTLTVRVRQEIRILSLYAVHFLCDRRILYDREQQELTILSASTRTPDGRTIDVPPKGINTSTPESAASAPDFAFLTETVVTFIAVEKGATLILEYELKDVRPWRTHSEGVFFLGEENVPVLDGRLSVKVSARSKFHSLVFGPEGRIATAEPELHRGHTVHTWTATDLPAYAPLPWNRFAVVPGVAFSTADSWEAVLRDVSSYAHEPAPGDAPSERDPFAAITLMRNSLRIVGHMTDFPLWAKLRPPDAVLASRRASPLEAAAVLSRRLANEGLAPRIVLASPFGMPEGQVPPCLGLMTDTFVEVAVQDHQLFVDMNGFGVLHRIPYPAGRLVAVVPRGARSFTAPAETYLKNRNAGVFASVEYMVEPGRLAVEASIDTRGAASLYVEWLDRGGGKDAATWLASRFGRDLAVVSFSVDSASPERLSLRIQAARKLALGDPVVLPAAPLASTLDSFVVPWVEHRLRPGLAELRYEAQVTIQVIDLQVVPESGPASVTEESSYFATTFSGGTDSSTSDVSFSVTAPAEPGTSSSVPPAPAPISVQSFAAASKLSLAVLSAR